MSYESCVIWPLCHMTTIIWHRPWHIASAVHMASVSYVRLPLHPHNLNPDPNPNPNPIALQPSQAREVRVLWLSINVKLT